MLRARIQYMEYRYTVHYRGKLYTVYNSWFQAGHKQVYDFFLWRKEKKYGITPFYSPYRKYQSLRKEKYVSSKLLYKQICLYCYVTRYTI